MPLPLIPIVAIGASAAVAGTGIYAGVTSFFDARKDEEKVNSVGNSPDLTDNQAAVLAAQDNVNLNSKFQPVGNGMFSDYSQTLNENYQTTYQDVYHIYEIKDSPNTTIDTDTTQKADNTQTSTDSGDNPFSSFLSALGGSALPVIALVGVGGYLLLKGGKANG